MLVDKVQQLSKYVAESLSGRAAETGLQYSLEGLFEVNRWLHSGVKITFNGYLGVKSRNGLLTDYEASLCDTDLKRIVETQRAFAKTLLEAGEGLTVYNDHPVTGIVIVKEGSREVMEPEIEAIRASIGKPIEETHRFRSS